MERVPFKSALVIIECPFCHATLVSDYDHSSLDEEDEESDIPSPDWPLKCPHVAASLIWDLEDFNTIPEWAHELQLLTQKLGLEIDGGAEWLDLDSGAYLIEEAPDIRVQVENVFINKNDGPSGDGGTHFVIVLMNRP